jgi:hemolysin III
MNREDQKEIRLSNYNRNDQKELTRKEKMRRQQTLGEEIANSITHGVGTALSIAGLVTLVIFASLYGDAWRIVAFSIYGATLIFLYLSSTLYHSFQIPKVKKVFRIFDHSAIFLLIAGTYTPITLIALKGAWGWTLFGLIWVMAIAGIIFEIKYIGKHKLFIIFFYLMMGWLVVIAVKPIIENVEKGLIVWLLIGGACYTLGIIFYVLKKMRFHHMVWHLFVLAGSISHFLGMLFYLTRK